MSATVLAGAMVLDAMIGEPKLIWSKVPHPAVLMGRLVGELDARFNEGEMRRAKGAVCVFILVSIALIIGWGVSALGWLPELILGAILLAQRSLVDHVRDVANGLRISLLDGKMMVARIVGRETKEMDEPAVARAAVESAAENFSDGVIAPIFWFLVMGLPGILIYKFVNTTDSMIGYRTPKHEEFGWAAARLDDVLNVLPARITALLFAALNGQLGSWSDIRQEARRHRSPNAGWPEAAMARAIDTALSGPRTYNGVREDQPFVHPDGKRDAGPKDIDRSVHILWLSWATTLAIVIAISFF